MSGMVYHTGVDEVQERYAKRLHQLTQRNPENPHKSLAPSTVGSLSESTINGQYFNNKGQSANGTLGTHQFYKKHSDQDQSQAGNIPSNKLLMDGSSTYTGVSDASVFKKPLPIKRSSYDPHIKRRLDLMVEACLSLDKPTLKFSMTAFETIVHTLKNPPYSQPVNPVLLMDHISNLVKEVYSAKRVPKSICGSSVTSDQASSIDPYSRVALQDITQSSMYRAQCNRPSQDLTSLECSSINGRTELPNHQLQTSRVIEAANKRDRRQLMETLIETGLLNDTEIAQRRDEAAARQEQLAIIVPNKNGKMLPKATPKPAANASKVNKITKATTTKKPNSKCSKESVLVSENCNSDRGNQNISLMNGTATGMSRCGRTLKPPVKYWNSKGDELSFVEADESILNESMTLRNKKVLDKKKTLPLKKSTPTLSTSEAPIPPSTTKRSRGKPAKGKENMTAENKKPVKKPTGTPVVKNNSVKTKTNKKKAEVTNQNSEKIVKKPAPKRKSKEPNNSTTKKKKIEDPLASDADEDDIFGSTTYRKPTFLLGKGALSPSAALLSAKKAAGEAQGKATPPCKAIGELIGNESIQSVMSAAKEAPKQNEAIKRIIKKMEKDQMKLPMQQQKAKPQVKKTRKEDSHFNELMKAVTKSTYSVNNSVCSATLTVFKGNELESDFSDMEQDDDDDDLM